MKRHERPLDPITRTGRTAACARAFRAILIAALAAGMLAAGPAAQGGAPPTDVRVIVPFVQGRLSPAFTVHARLSGRCFAASLATQGRPDAWRCMSKNMILDPCFQELGQMLLACLPSPWSTRVTLLAAAEPLPLGQANHEHLLAHLPWAVELADGERCQVLTGATTSVAGMRLNYGCEDRTTSIIGDPDRTEPRWRMFEQHGNGAEVRLVGVATAWY